MRSAPCKRGSHRTISRPPEDAGVGQVLFGIQLAQSPVEGADRNHCALQPMSMTVE